MVRILDSKCYDECMVKCFLDEDECDELCTEQCEVLPEIRGGAS